MQVQRSCGCMLHFRCTWEVWCFLDVYENFRMIFEHRSHHSEPGVARLRGRTGSKLTRWFVPSATHLGVVSAEESGSW